MLLRHIVEQSFLNICVTGIVLDKTEDVGAVNITDCTAFANAYYKADAVLEKSICPIRLDLGYGVCIILKAVDEHTPIRTRSEARGLGFVISAAGHIVSFRSLVILGYHIVIIRIVLEAELDLAEISLAIRELLCEVKPEHVDVTVIDERIVIAAVRAFPSEDDVVGIALVAVVCGLVQLGRVCDAESAVGIAGVHHRSIGIHGLAGVDLGKAGFRHHYTHNVAARFRSGVADIELAVSLCPCRYLVRAVCVLEELKRNAVLEIRDAFLSGIYEAVIREIRSRRSNGRECGDDLVLKNVADRGSCGMCKAICDVCAAVVLAAAGLCLTYSLFERRDAGKVLGVERHIVKPACVICGAGHGQRDEERRSSLCYHFGDASLDEEIQTKGEVTDRGMTVAVGLRHGNAAVLADVGFKCVLDRGCIICKRVFQRIDEHIRLIRIYIVVICGSMFVNASSSTLGCKKSYICSSPVISPSAKSSYFNTKLRESFSASVRSCRLIWR